MRDGEEPTLQAQEEAGDDFAITPLDGDSTAPRGLPLTLLHALRGQQRRVAAVAATTLLVVMVIVGLFAHVTSDPGGALATLLLRATPTPAATFVADANSIYFSNGAPWGTLAIDGKRLPSVDLTGYGVSVTRGTHHLVYQARYFPSLRCTFSAPRAQSDTCPLDTSDATLQFLLSYPLARAIDLGSTSATLQPDQLSALTQLADSMLKAQTLTATIAPGARYLDAQGRIVTASAPLQFQMTQFVGGAEISGPGGACAQFCPDSTFSNGPHPNDGGWLTMVTITASWSITDTSGRPQTGIDYQAGQPFPGTEPTTVSILLTPSGWRLHWLEDVSGVAVENAAAQSINPAVAEGSDALHGMSFTLAPNPLDGCVMDVDIGDQTARVYWRFGVLVAVDASARQEFPNLLVADAEEQTAVANIMRQQPALRDDSILPTG